MTDTKSAPSQTLPPALYLSTTKTPLLPQPFAPWPSAELLQPIYRLLPITPSSRQVTYHQYHGTPNDHPHITVKHHATQAIARRSPSTRPVSPNVTACFDAVSRRYAFPPPIHIQSSYYQVPDACWGTFANSPAHSSANASRPKSGISWVSQTAASFFTMNGGVRSAKAAGRARRTRPRLLARRMPADARCELFPGRPRGT